VSLRGTVGRTKTGCSSLYSRWERRHLKPDDLIRGNDQDNNIVRVGMSDLEDTLARKTFDGVLKQRLSAVRG